MPELLIRIKKNKDGSAALTCVRADGTRTWQRQEGSLGAFFPPHDLTHYAVESVLGYGSAFYGLIADGWEIGDFSVPFNRGTIPAEVREVEAIVGAFDFERGTGEHVSAAVFNEQLRFLADRDTRTAFTPRTLTDDELARVRAARAEVFARWEAVEPGATLELPFSRDSGP